MWQKIFVLIAIFILIFQVGFVQAWDLPTPGRKCEGSELADGTYIPAGEVREVTLGGVRYRCVGCGGCTPISSASSGRSSSSTPSISSYETMAQQMAIGLMGAFLSGFFNSLMSGIFDDKSNYYAQKQREYEEQQRRLRLEEEKRKQEEQKKKLLSQYNLLIAQAKTQTQTQTNQSNSPFTFQTLGSQLTAFQWQSLSSNNLAISNLNTQDENLVKVSDITTIFGNVIQEKTTEQIVEKIEEFGGKIVEKLDKKYGKEWGSKLYKGLPIIKIAVTAKTEGIASAGAETIDYAISLIPMPTLSKEVSDIGRKIYTKIAFSALDKFLTEMEKAGEVLGLNLSKDEFMQNFESDMNLFQKIIYKWVRGE